MFPFVDCSVKNKWFSFDRAKSFIFKRGESRERDIGNFGWDLARAMDWDRFTLTIALDISMKPFICKTSSHLLLLEIELLFMEYYPPATENLLLVLQMQVDVVQTMNHLSRPPLHLLHRYTILSILFQWNNWRIYESRLLKKTMKILNSFLQGIFSFLFSL